MYRVFLLLTLLAGCSPPPAPDPPPAVPTYPLPPPGKQIVVLLFLAPDCPISNAYAPEICRIRDEYSQKGVYLAVVYAVPDLPAPDMYRHASAYGLGSAVSNIGWRDIAKKYGVTTVPEAAVLAPDRSLLYRGRIDDRYPAPGGKRREHPTTRDLRDALDAALAGKPIAVPRTPPVGCDIDFGPDD